MNGEAWIVLGVGIATVAFQWWTSRKTGEIAGEQVEAARRQAEAAELQSKVAEAALERELSAVLVASRGTWGPGVAQVIVHNAGEHTATNVELAAIDPTGAGVGHCQPMPVVGRGSEATFDISYSQDAAERERFGSCEEVELKWIDGRGPRTERIPLMRR